MNCYMMNKPNPLIPIIRIQLAKLKKYKGINIFATT